MTSSFRVRDEAFERAPRRLAAEGSFVTACVPFGGEASPPWPTEIREHLLAAVC